MQGYFDIVDDATKERKRDISEYVPLSRVGDVVIKVEYGVEKVKSVGSRRRCGSEEVRTGMTWVHSSYLQHK
jgi:hypothetical protein